MLDLRKPFRTAFAACAMLAVSAAGGMGPTLAQGLPFGLEFGFHFGDNDSRAFNPRRFCMPTDAGLREAVEDEGYDDIYLNVPIGRHVQVRATRGEWVYLLRVDICTYEIVDRERLRRS